MNKIKFTRRNTTQYLRLGKKRKKLQKWRKPKGRHNKMRKKRKGYPATVSIGYSTNKIGIKQINGKDKVIVNNLSDLEKVQHNQIAVIGKIGNKNKIEIAKRAQNKNIEISNLNVKKFLKNVEKKKGEKLK
ncbi:MAG TPA: eL32 family ribosomal protein [Candidatus Paceibacterota bacterium]|nr:eL32 family ribosomal protein [Candidatus Paceibacterota bacterium]